MIYRRSGLCGSCRCANQREFTCQPVHQKELNLPYKTLLVHMRSRLPQANAQSKGINKPSLPPKGDPRQKQPMTHKRAEKVKSSKEKTIMISTLSNVKMQRNHQHCSMIGVMNGLNRYFYASRILRSKIKTSLFL